MKKLVSIIMALMLAIGLCVTTAWAGQESVSYIDLSQDEPNQICDTYTEVASSAHDVTWNTGWYVVNKNVTIEGAVNFADGADVRLILMDDCTLTIKDGVSSIGEGKSLTIYGQAEDTGTLEIISGKAIGYNYASGPGTCFGIGVWALTIHGGTINTTGGTANPTVSAENNALAFSYGINAGSMIIYGGTVTATGGTATSEKEAFSYGINVTGIMTVYGGTVTTTGGIAKTAGGGASSSGINVGGTMTVSGGMVNATGGAAFATADGGTSSYGFFAGNLIFNSGTLTVKRTASCDSIDNIKAIYIASDFTLPGMYWWRTEENGDFSTETLTVDVAKATFEAATYAQMTTVQLTDSKEDDGTQNPDTPDAEPSAPTHSHTKRQNTTTTTDTTATDTTKTDTVTSAKTFDAGVAVYGAMAIASLLGMGYVGKKRV